MLQVKLLGPVAAFSPTGPVPLGGNKPRALLATLVLERGRVVPASRLIDVLWPDNPPDSARSLIQTYVSTLRKSLAQHGYPDVIDTRAPGYTARLERATVDVDVFTEMVGQARECAREGGHGAALELLRRAIGLCGGPALSGLEESALAGEARRLDQMLVSAHSDRFEAELHLGGLDHLAELTGLVARHPTDERLRGQLMVTLCRAGRHTDALACYREGRAALIDELGVEPGPRLQELHGAILRGDAPEGAPGGAAPQTARLGGPVYPGVGCAGGPPPGVAGRPGFVPAQTPSAPPDFTGREKVRNRLVTALRAAAPGIHVLTGQGGSGKSALAVWVAHQAAHVFPDGQLFADLRGMTDAPATTDEVLAGFLRSLGVNPSHLPDSTQARTELYRSLVAPRRMLILLDDAAGEPQVRPLLPTGPGCGAVVTSRDALSGLAGAAFTELPVLDDHEARELLGRIVGVERAHSDAEAVRRIVAACDHLPLAIRIAGARLATRRHLPLAALAERLTDERQRLDELAVGDLAVRSSINLSYGALDAPAAAALRALGFFGVPEFTSWVLGWLLDVPAPAAERLLELLVDAHLVEFMGVDQAGVLWYRMHDLVRIYARECAAAEDRPEYLREGVSRVISGWHALVDRMAAASPPAEMAWRRPPAPRLPISDELVRRVLTDATGWLQREEPVTVVGVERAAAIGLHELVCGFVSARMALEPEGGNRFEFRQRVVGLALDAARRAGDPRGEAMMLVEVGHLRYAEDRYVEARHYHNEALSRFRTTHDAWGQAIALAGLGISCRKPGHLAEALHFLNQAAALLQALDDVVGIGYVHRVRGSVLLEQGNAAMALADLELSLQAYQRMGNRTGIAYTLRNLGVYHRSTGDHEQALRVCAEAAEIFTELGDELMHSYAVRAYATAQLRMGLAEEALPQLEWALGVARDAGDRWGEAMALRVLGQLYLGQGRLDAAQRSLDAAMALWDAMQAPLWRARTEYDLSLLYRARGDGDAADEAFDNAYRIFRDRNSREFAELSGAGEAGAGALQASLQSG